jgi:hypothetical protein
LQVGDAIVIQEGDEVADSPCDADVARLPKVCLWAARGLNFSGEIPQHGLGVVHGWPVDDDHFENLVSLLAQR